MLNVVHDPGKTMNEAQEAWIQEQMVLHPLNGQDIGAWFQERLSEQATQSTQATYDPPPPPPPPTQYSVQNGFDHQHSQPQYIPQYLHQPSQQQPQSTPPLPPNAQPPPSQITLQHHNSYTSTPSYSIPDPSPNGHASKNPLNPNPYYYPATTSSSYSYQPSYSASVDHQRPPFSASTYMSSYSSLDGATNTNALQSNNEPQQQITIDPQLVSMSPNVSKYLPAQTIPPTRLPFHTTISPSSLHAAIPQQHSYYNLTTAQQAQTKPSPAAQTQPPQPAPVAPRKSPDSLIRDLISSRSFEKSPAAAAVSLIKALAQMGINDTSASLRKDILNAMRDNAGKEFFEAWAKNPDGMETFRVWLKTASTKKDSSGKKELEETLMPLLNVIDRLPLGLEELRTSRIGKVIKSIVADPPSGAAKDLASVLTQKWTSLITQHKTEEGPSGSAFAADKAKKRKAVEVSAAKAPPAKRVAPPPSSALGTVQVKREGVKSEPIATKAAKSDSSFFSAPKKKALPSFKKVAPVKREESGSVSQPSSIDPFQEALKAMTKSSAAVKSATPPTQTSTPTASASSGDTMMAPVTTSTDGTIKRKKSVAFAPDDKLEMIKYITRADYPDDPSEPLHSLNDVRALDRDEGRALHNQIFQEAIDWNEPILIEFPQDPGFPTMEPRGSQSVEAGIQEEREKSALIASYMSPSHIPDTASELHSGIGDPDPSEPPTLIMLPGAEISALAASASAAPVPSSLNDLLAQITTNSAAGPQGMVPSADAWGQPQQPQNAAAAALLQQLGLGGLGNGNRSGMLPTDIASMLSNLSPEAMGMMQQQQQPPSQQQQQQQQQPQFGGSFLQQQQQQQQQQQVYGDSSQGSYWNNEPSSQSWGGGGDGWGDNSGFGRPRGRGRGFGGGRGRGGNYDHRPKKLCNFFAKGYCRFGEACDFWHDPSLAHLQQKP